MKKLLLYAITWLAFGIATAQSNNETDKKPNTIAARFKITATPIAITNINIVNVNTGKIDPDQTIIINNGRITAVGASKNIKVPADATLIHGDAKFAMPGLTDSHIHFFQSGGLYTRPDALSIPSVFPYEKDQQYIKDNLDDMLARYLACGITNVVDVGGPMANFAIRDKANLEISAPNALVTGPLISTLQPTVFSKEDPPIIKASTADEGIALVRKQLPYKPDFIKIWYLADNAADAAKKLPMVKAVVKEAHANGLKVCVHATEYETASLAVDAGADILVHSVDDKIIFQPLIAALKSKNVIYIPTLQVYDNYLRTFSQRFAFTAHDLKYANPYLLGSNMDLQHIDRSLSGIDYKALQSRPIPTPKDSIMSKNLLMVAQAGITIVAGTDAGNIGTHHGSSLLTELRMMKAAGLSEMEILRSATINAAKAFGKENDWGSIEKNKVADILLLDSDPFKSLDAFENIPKIIHRGVLIETPELLPNDPESIVQQQLNAYNAGNIDAFLATFSDNAEIYDLQGKTTSKGKAEIRRAYEGFFKTTPDLHCEIIKRIVSGNVVIDRESVTGMGAIKTTALAIYEVENGKIASAYFKRY
jgi:imidazolonepropionase-like amidohydrolase